MDALAGFDFFADDAALNNPLSAKLQVTSARNRPHVGLSVRFQNGENATRRERLLAWLPAMLPAMLPALDAVRGCVDGEAATALDQLLAQLADDRKRWGPDPLAEGLKNLQGSWVTDTTGKDQDHIAKCTIDGKNITLKPDVQVNPLFDLETIRGTFELFGGWWPKRTIKGVRDTVSKQESGTWTALYRVTGTTLKLLLAPAGDSPLPEWKPRPDKGDREFTFQRVAIGPVSDWGDGSNGVQTRIHAFKAKYLVGEAPSFDLDVRDTHAGVAGKPWHWLGRRLADVARIEVDGVWFRTTHAVPSRYVPDRLNLGQTVETWVTIKLAAPDWILDGDNDKPQLLVLRPGKHKVRVGFDFSPSEGGLVPAAPVSGSVEIEVLTEKSIGHASDWGEPSKGSVPASGRPTRSSWRARRSVSIWTSRPAAMEAGNWPSGLLPETRPRPG